MIAENLVREFDEDENEPKKGQFYIVYLDHKYRNMDFLLVQSLTVFKYNFGPVQYFF
jgi:hypothetical protein